MREETSPPPSDRRRLLLPRLHERIKPEESVQTHKLLPDQLIKHTHELHTAG